MSHSLIYPYPALFCFLTLQALSVTSRNMRLWKIDPNKAARILKDPEVAAAIAAKRSSSAASASTAAAAAAAATTPDAATAAADEGGSSCSRRHLPPMKN